MSGAGSSMVKLANNSIVSLAQYQRLFDAAAEGEEPQIAGILSGAEEGMVRLADNRIVTLAQYVREVQEAEQGEEPSIAASLAGAYSDIVKTAAGTTSLEELYRVAPESPS